MCKSIRLNYLRQPTENSCWLACAAMVANYYGENNPNLNVEKFAERYGFDINEMGSAVEAIETALRDTYKNMEMPADECAIPTFEEIKKQILGDNDVRESRPLLCCVGITEGVPYPEDTSRAKPELEYEGGHWILIVGFEDDNICVADPSAREWNITKVPYDLLEYKRQDARLYWKNTSYLDFNNLLNNTN